MATAIDPRLDSRHSWVIAVAGMTSMFVVFGVAYSFGAFFGSMSEEFGTGSGQTALIFSITISLSFVLGMFTGRWADRVGPKPVLIAGAVSLVVGLLLTAVVPRLWMGYISYGGGVGFAVACGYVPMVATVGGWFQRKRAGALGLSVAGIGLGTLVGSPLAARLISATSWRVTYVIFAAAGGSLLVLVAMVAERGPAAPPASRPRSLIQMMRIRDFALLYGATVFVSLGLFVPFVFIAAFAEDRGVGEVAAASLVGIIGGASVVGRLGLGGLADRAGAVRLFKASFVIVALSHLIWLFAGDGYGVLVVYTVALGVGYGGFIALSPAVAALRFGLDGLGGLLGTMYTAAAIGSLAGPPLAGALIDRWGYRVAISFAVIVSTVAVLILAPFRLPEPGLGD